MNRLSFLALMCMVATIPMDNVEYHVPFIEFSVPNTFLAITLGLALVDGIFSVWRLRFGRMHKTLFLLLVLYLVFYLASIYTSMIPGIGWEGFKGVIGSMVAGVLTAWVVRERWQFQGLLGAIMVGACISLGTSVLKIQGLVPLSFPNPDKVFKDVTEVMQLYAPRNYGIFFTSGRFALWHSYIVLFGLYLLLFRRIGWVARVGLLALVAVDWVEIVVAQSRNGVVITTFGSLLILMYWQFERRVGLNRYIRASFMVFTAFLYPFLIYLVTTKVFTYVYELRGFEGRFYNLELGFSLLFPDRWFWGAGPNVFSLYHVAGLDLHNSYLSVWVESGLMCFLLFLCLLLIPWVSVFNWWRRGVGLRGEEVRTDRALGALMLIMGATWMVGLSVFPGKDTHEVWVLVALMASFWRLYPAGEGTRPALAGAGQIERGRGPAGAPILRNEQAGHGSRRR